MGNHHGGVEGEGDVRHGAVSRAGSFPVELRGGMGDGQSLCCDYADLRWVRGVRCVAVFRR